MPWRPKPVPQPPRVRQRARIADDKKTRTQEEEDSKQFFQDLLDAQWPQPRSTAERLREKYGWNVQVEQSSDDVLDRTQLVLDIASLFPGANIPASLVNATISTLRGRYGDAGLSVIAAAVPGVKAGKLIKGMKFAQGPGTAWRHSAVWGKRYQKLGFQDHHIFTNKTEAVRDHAIWAAAGIVPDSRVNKILLPVAGVLHPTRSIHRGRHTVALIQGQKATLDAIYSFGNAAGWKQPQYNAALVQALKAERSLLQGGHRALNKNARAWAEW